MSANNYDTVKFFFDTIKLYNKFSVQCVVLSEIKDNNDAINEFQSDNTRILSEYSKYSQENNNYHKHFGTIDLKDIFKTNNNYVTLLDTFMNHIRVNIIVIYDHFLKEVNKVMYNRKIYIIGILKSSLTPNKEVDNDNTKVDDDKCNLENIYISEIVTYRNELKQLNIQNNLNSKHDTYNNLLQPPQDATCCTNKHENIKTVMCKFFDNLMSDPPCANSTNNKTFDMQNYFTNNINCAIECNTKLLALIQNYIIKNKNKNDNAQVKYIELLKKIQSEGNSYYEYYPQLCSYPQCKNLGINIIDDSSILGIINTYLVGIPCKSGPCIFCDRHYIKFMISFLLGVIVYYIIPNTTLLISSTLLTFCIHVIMVLYCTGINYTYIKKETNTQTQPNVDNIVSDIQSVLDKSDDKDETKIINIFNIFNKNCLSYNHLSPTISSYINTFGIHFFLAFIVKSLVNLIINKFYTNKKVNTRINEYIQLFLKNLNFK